MIGKEAVSVEQISLSIDEVKKRDTDDISKDEKIIAISNENNFKLLSKSELTFDYINKQLINYPKVETILKNNIEKTMYCIIEAIFSYKIENSSRIKLKHLKTIVIQLSMLDYYMRVSYKKKIISVKKFQSIARYLQEIKLIAYGVIRYEKSVG